MTLKELRQKKGMTLRRLSQLTGLGLSTIGNYETGKTSISQESLKKIADVFDVSPDSLRDPVSVIYEVLDGKKQRGGFKMEQQAIEEVRVRIEQFALANPETRRTLIEQIVTRLNEYADWCEGHYHELHESLLTHARGQSIPTHSAPKAKRARLRDIDTVSLPIFGKIPAGFPQDLDESPSTTRLMRVRRGRFPEGAFGLEVRGDSMNAARGKFGQIKDGEIVVLLPPGLREPQHGDVVAALCDGQTTLKRLDCCLGPKCVLRAESDQPTWQHGITPVHDLSIQGVMIGKL